MNREETALEREHVTTAPARQEGSPRKVRVRRLARVELGRTWPSYLVSVLVTFFLGLVSLNTVWMSLEGFTNTPGIPASFWADFCFLLFLANLGINWTSLRWMYVHRDPFTGWLAFLRTMPVSARELVASRALIMLSVAVVMSFVFFLPAYAFFGVLRAEIPPLRYLWFALFWFGYALLSGGALLFLEWGLKGKSVLAIQALWVTLLVCAMVLAAVLDVPLVDGSLNLVGAHGPLPALAALAVGGGGLYLWCRLLERRLRTREMGL